MKALPTLLFVCILLAYSKSNAQMAIPGEDLIMGKSGVWEPRSGYNTDGSFGNAWVYFNDNYLLYHYQTPKNEHTLFYLIRKTQGGTDAFCRDSCITIKCYDSAQSVYIKNKSDADSSFPVVVFTINYGAGETQQFGNGPVVHKSYVLVDINDYSYVGSFQTPDKKSFKSLIPSILAKHKTFEYEANPIDDVPFTHATFNWSQLAFDTHDYSIGSPKLKQDSITLVQRKRHYDSLFNIPPSVRKRAADSLANLALNNYWVQFWEVGDTTKEPQASIITLLKENNVPQYKYHFYKRMRGADANRYYAVYGDEKSNWGFYVVNLLTKKVDGPHMHEMMQYPYPMIIK